MTKTVIGPCLLILGDCLETLPKLNPVDACITDPPYGIGFEYKSHDDSRELWYDLMNQFIPLAKASAKFVVMPSCGIDRIGWWYANHPPDWMIAWYKGSPGHLSKIGFNDWESHLTWGKPPKQMHDFFQTPLVIDPNGHPCPKPVAYAEWLVTRGAPVGGTVIDPFMGSGTTGVACVRSGRRFIGIEKEPEYYEICVDRISRAWRRKQSELPIDDEPVRKYRTCLEA